MSFYTEVPRSYLNFIDMYIQFLPQFGKFSTISFFFFQNFIHIQLFLWITSQLPSPSLLFLGYPLS